MKPKKNPSKDLSKKSPLFFVIGLTFILAFVWMMMEMKTTHQSEMIVTSLVLKDLSEPIPIVVLKKPIPPPPPVIPKEPEILPDDSDIPETPFATTESEPNEVIPEVLPYDDPIEDIPIHFVSEAPIFPGCENVAKQDQKACFEKMVGKHVQKKFRYPKSAQEMGISGRVFIQFMIDENGQVQDIQMRGPDRNLEKEAQRIISLLPDMIPGKHQGKPVRVTYSLPINFKLRQ